MKLQAKSRLLALQDLKTLGPRLLEVLKDTFETSGFELLHGEIRSGGRLSDGMFKIAGRDLNNLVFKHLGYKVRDQGSTIYWDKHGEPTWCMTHTAGKVHLYQQDGMRASLDDAGWESGVNVNVDPSNTEFQPTGDNLDLDQKLEQDILSDGMGLGAGYRLIDTHPAGLFPKEKR